MKKRILYTFLLLVAVLVIVIVVMRLMGDRDTSASVSDTAAEFPTPEVSGTSSSQSVENGEKPDVPPDAAPVSRAAAEPLQPAVERKAVAMVNGIAVYEDSLDPVESALGPTASPEQIEMFQKEALERAVEIEMIKQEAERRSISLTPEQQAMVDGIMRQAEYDASFDAGDGRSLPPTALSHIKLRQDKLASEYLLTEMMKQDGLGPMAVSDSEIASYYQENISSFTPLSDNEDQAKVQWRMIQLTIRAHLDAANQSVFRERQQKFLRQLSSEAAVEYIP